MTTSNEHNNAPAVPQGWREVFDRAHNRLSNDDPSAFDNSGYRAYAGQVLDYVEDELDALTSKAAQSQSTATHKCNTCGVVGAEDPVKGCLNCGFDDMQRIAATPAPAPAQERCHLCDCTGDIHDATGEWRGVCPHCKPAQEVGLTDEAIDHLVDELSDWFEDTANQTLEAHVREVLEKNAIIAALRAKGAV